MASCQYNKWFFIGQLLLRPGGCSRQNRSSVQDFCGGASTMHPQVLSLAVLWVSRILVLSSKRVFISENQGYPSLLQQILYANGVNSLGGSSAVLSASSMQLGLDKPIRTLKVQCLSTRAHWAAVLNFRWSFHVLMLEFVILVHESCQGGVWSRIW